MVIRMKKSYVDTKAEFRRLKTILPSIRRKDNVSKLDIILEAIKYIDDLQDQLMDRLSERRHVVSLLSLGAEVRMEENGDGVNSRGCSSSEDEEEEVEDLPNSL
ncbi:unnamed protein product [Lepeophtheirus salmonis]|uniref:(salmon louse) hypothetical protein n=1 Tax=Lepeophtheirus salmonis TaxID=72036 RepID=A0A7R8D4F9_LEPSM|nr:unnamed protein product [Lepeophtheirus salmonis]CAF3023607.1 unnamed protein product [Lepeophtheirus salmonis]